MKTKQFLLLVALSACALSVAAQTDLSYGRKYKQEEAGSLLKQVPQFSTDNFNVDYTGMSAISIDLYTLEEDGVKIPIRLSYNPNATRVDDRASWVGFGWDLDIGGNVARSVNGTPDDVVTTAKMGLALDTPNFVRIVNPLRGYAISGAKRINNYNWSMNLVTSSDRNLIYQALGNITNKYFKKINYDPVANELYFPAGTTNWSVYNDEGFDANPDVFYYNLFGRKGKFVFGYSYQEGLTKPRTIPYDNIDINWSLDEPTTYYNADDITNKYNLRYPFQTSGAYAFDIKDDNGCRYRFDVPDSSYITNSSYPAWGIGCDHFFLRDITPESSSFAYKKNDKWNISELTTAHGRSIRFDYQRDTFYTINASRKTSNIDFVNSAAFFVGIRFHDISVSGSVNFTHKIKTIETDNERIDFILSDDHRLDVPTSKRLDRIIVYRKTLEGTIEKFRVELGYDYFTTNNDPTIIYQTILSMFPSGNMILDNPSKKLKLTSLQFKSNSTVVPPYRFTYDETAPIPCRNSVRRDLYGYYNGSNNVSNYMYPRLYVYPNKTGADRYTINRRQDWVSLGEPELTLEGADRNTYSSITTGTLKRITTPTDGYIDYTFEPNQYFWAGTNIAGGGIRIKNIITNPNINGSLPVVRNYTYSRAAIPGQSSGKLLSAPILAYGENHCGYDGSTFTPASFPRNSMDYIKAFTWRLENPEFSGLIDAGGPVVGYEEVTEDIPGKGKTVYTYWVPGMAGTPVIEPLYTNTNSGIEDFNNIVPVTRLINGGGYYESVPPSQESHLFLDVTTTMDNVGVDASDYSYFAGPKINLDWARGMPFSKKLYTSSNSLTYEEQYQYQLMSPGSFGPVYIPGLRQGNNRVYNMLNFLGNSDDMFATNCMYYTFFQQVANVKMALKSVEKKDYGTVSGGGVSSTTVYEYANSAPANQDPYPRSVTTVNSDGTSLIRRYKYPRDYVGSILGGSSNILNGIPLLLSSNSYSSLIETWDEQVKSGATAAELLHADLNEYNLFSNAPDAGILRSKLYKLSTNTPLTNFAPSSVSGIGASSVFNKDPRYLLEQEVNRVDYRGLALQSTESRTGRVISNIMGYRSLKPIASADNASLTDIAFSSFEEPPYPPLGTINEAKGNWEFDPEFIANDATCPTGGRFYGLYAENGNPAFALNTELLTVNALQNGKAYILSFWVKNIPGPVTAPDVYNGTVLQPLPAPLRTANGWSYYEVPLNGAGSRIKLNLPVPATVGLINNIPIDEVRLYPAGSAMRTLSYSPQSGQVTSSADEAGNISYFEYDNLGRLIRERDVNRNVTKQYTYQYKAQ